MSLHHGVPRCAAAAHARLASARAAATSVAWEPGAACGDAVVLDGHPRGQARAPRGGAPTAPAPPRGTDAVSSPGRGLPAAASAAVGAPQMDHERPGARAGAARSQVEGGVLVVELGPLERLDLDHVRREGRRAGEGDDAHAAEDGGPDPSWARCVAAPWPREAGRPSVRPSWPEARGTAGAQHFWGIGGRRGESCASAGAAVRPAHNLELGSSWPAADEPAGDFELCAVPKRRVTPSRKGLRSGNRKLKLSRAAPRVLYKCSECGRMRLPHHVCYYCIKMAGKARPAPAGGALEAAV